MIVKIADFYYDANMSQSSVVTFLNKCLAQHIEDSDELDLEHYLDMVEENEEFESAPDANDYDLEVTLAELEMKIEDLLEEKDDDKDFEDYDDYIASAGGTVDGDEE